MIRNGHHLQGKIIIEVSSAFRLELIPMLSRIQVMMHIASLEGYKYFLCTRLGTLLIRCNHVMSSYSAHNVLAVADSTDQ